MSNFGKRKKRSDEDFDLYSENPYDELTDNSNGGDKHGKRKLPGSVVVTLLVALIPLIGVTIGAYLNSIAPLQIARHETQTAEARPTFTATVIADTATPTLFLTKTTTPVLTGRLEGVITDRESNSLSDLSVSIQNGPAAKTDINGNFVLDGVEEGDQIIVVKPPSGGGQFSMNVSIRANQTSNVNIVYDAASSRLGLLSITAPVDGADLEVRQDLADNGVIVHRATIFGRCDGLGQIFQNGFDIWVLITSERDGKFWVQFPAAVIDPNNNTWRANIVLGDAQHPPLNGELWTIVAVAADPDSGIDRITNTRKLTLLPPHVTSNVVSVTSQIK